MRSRPLTNLVVENPDGLPVIAVPQQYNFPKPSAPPATAFPPVSPPPPTTPRDHPIPIYHTFPPTPEASPTTYPPAPTPPQAQAETCCSFLARILGFNTTPARRAAPMTARRRP